jgi:pre-rRNA-processing protein IPI1
MAIYFPFRTADMKRDMQVRILCHVPLIPCVHIACQTEDAFQDLNLTFCELSSLLLLSAQTSTKPNKSVSTQIVHVAAHIVNLLHGEPTNSAGALGRPLSSQAYTALLPTIWALLASRTKANAGDALLRAVLEHAIRGSATSATKRASVEFVGRLALVRHRL